MTAPKKRGPKPKLWKGPPGERFANAVYDLEAQRPLRSRAWAIREILKRDEFAYLRKYKIRTLEQRITTASERWKPGQGFGWYSQLTEPVRTKQRR